MLDTFRVGSRTTQQTTGNPAEQAASKRKTKHTPACAAPHLSPSAFRVPPFVVHRAKFNPFLMFSFLPPARLALPRLKFVSLRLRCECRRNLFYVLHICPYKRLKGVRFPLALLLYSTRVKSRCRKSRRPPPPILLERGEYSPGLRPWLAPRVLTVADLRPRQHFPFLPMPVRRDRCATIEFGMIKYQLKHHPARSIPVPAELGQACRCFTPRS